jgi:cytochrome P450
MHAYFAQAIADRRDDPRDDLVTRLVQAEIDGKRLTDAEIIAFCALLLVAGNETTTSLITTAVRGLVAHPEQTATLRARPELIDGLIEETLRWESPIQGFYRRATVDTELAGQPVKDGDALLVLFAAANRDPARFSCPHDFDIERGSHDHVAFGVGNHHCLGANLARLEARISLQAVLERFETLTPVEGHEDAWRDTPFVRGLVEYPLRFTLKRRAADAR